ncbi:MAG TPA: hypothetical protein P5260_08395 [Candidatus Competibacter sp.]|nr:hypothetical protein [Candidatus Competibacter sp.]
MAEQLNSFPEKLAAIARALANDPPIILADESTGNVDTHTSANVRQILHDLTGDMGKTVIVVTRDLTFAKAADRIIGIVGGRIDPDWRA